MARARRARRTVRKASRRRGASRRGGVAASGKPPVALLVAGAALLAGGIYLFWPKSANAAAMPIGTPGALPGPAVITRTPGGGTSVRYPAPAPSGGNATGGSTGMGNLGSGIDSGSASATGSESPSFDQYGNLIS